MCECPASSFSFILKAYPHLHVESPALEGMHLGEGTPLPFTKAGKSTGDDH